MCPRMHLRPHGLPNRILVVVLAVMKHEPIEARHGTRESVVKLPERGAERVGDAFFAVASDCARFAHVQTTADFLGSGDIVWVMTNELYSLAVVEKIGQIG